MFLSDRRPAEISRAGLFFAGLSSCRSPYPVNDRLSYLWSWFIPWPVINGTWYILWSWYILACHHTVIIICLLSPVFTPTVWGCIGLIMLIMGPILWILHRTTPYYEYVDVQKLQTISLSSFCEQSPYHSYEAHLKFWSFWYSFDTKSLVVLYVSFVTIVTSRYVDLQELCI